MDGFLRMMASRHGILFFGKDPEIMSLVLKRDVRGPFIQSFYIRYARGAGGIIGTYSLTCHELADIGVLDLVLSVLFTQRPRLTVVTATALHPSFLKIAYRAGTGVSAVTTAFPEDRARGIPPICRSQRNKTSEPLSGDIPGIQAPGPLGTKASAASHPILLYILYGQDLGVAAVALKPPAGVLIPVIKFIGESDQSSKSFSRMIRPFSASPCVKSTVCKDSFHQIRLQGFA